jgi:hypothetical protein
VGVIVQPSLLGVLGLILNFGLPLVVGLITRPSWAPQLKGSLLLLVALVKTVLEAWVLALSSGVPFNFWAVLISTTVNFIIAVGAWFGLLKGTAIAELAKNSLLKDGDYIDSELDELQRE